MHLIKMLKPKPSKLAPPPPPPGGAPLASPAGSAQSGKSLRAQRRRLSVVSDNQFIEGVAPAGESDEAADITARASAESVVRAYAGVSKKGYAPYNPRKRNQDAVFMEEVVGPVQVMAALPHGPAGAAAAASSSGMAPPTSPTSRAGGGAAGPPGTAAKGAASNTYGGGQRSSPTATAAAAGSGGAGYSPTGAAASTTVTRYAKTHVFGVFDGHGEAGDAVSHHFAERLPGLLAAHPRWGADPSAALVDCLDGLERSLLADASIDSEFSGSTGIVAVVRNGVLTVANVGDSRCILGRVVPAAAANAGGAAGGGRSGGPAGGGGGVATRQQSSAAAAASAAGGYVWEAVPVSDDHKPDRPDEQRRILSRGGRVFAVEYDDGVDGPPRVWLAHMDIPGLAMSRSLGDTVAHSVGVVSAPELSVVRLGPEHRLLVVASDGLWEFMSNEEVVAMAAAHGDDPRKAVDALIAEANARWMREEQVIDDTTVIVAFLDAPPPQGAGQGSPTGGGGGELSSSSSSSSALQPPPQAVGVRIALASSSSSAAAATGYGGLTPS